MSNIPIKDWINEIDEQITNLRTNYVIKYSKNKYDLEYIYELKKYMFYDDFYEVNNKINDKNLEPYLRTFFLLDIQHLFIKKRPKDKNNNNEKINVEQFLNIYDDILDDFYKSLNSYYQPIIKKEFDELKNRKYKLKRVDYFNIFINYAYSLYETMYNPSPEYKKIFPEEYKNNITILNNFLNEPELMKLIKSQFKNVQVIKGPRPGTYVPNTNTGVKRKANVTEDRLSYIFDPDYKYASYSEYSERKKDLKKLGDEADEERDNIYINCKSSNDCKNINQNLNCENDIELNEYICKPNDLVKEIGEKCIKNDDCLSDYCKEYTKVINGKNDTIGICRKKTKKIKTTP